MDHIISFCVIHHESHECKVFERFTSWGERIVVYICYYYTTKHPKIEIVYPERKFSRTDFHKNFEFKVDTMDVEGYIIPVVK